MKRLILLIPLAVIVIGVLLAPMARADDNCVDRGWGMRLCRNPDNTLTFCGAGILAQCGPMTAEQMNILLGPGSIPPPAPGFSGSAFYRAAYIQFADHCVTYPRYTVCVGENQQWRVCDVDGKCHAGYPPAGYTSGEVTDK
jgi:hypothetical protein